MPSAAIAQIVTHTPGMPKLSASNPLLNKPLKEDDQIPKNDGSPRMTF
jgi:hypothetical protein